MGDRKRFIVFPSSTEEYLRKAVGEKVGTEPANKLIDAVPITVSSAVLIAVLHLDEFTPDTVLPRIFGDVMIHMKLERASSPAALKAMVEILKTNEDAFDEMLEQINETATAFQELEDQDDVVLFSPEVEEAARTYLAGSDPAVPPEVADDLFNALRSSLPKAALLEAMDLETFTPEEVTAAIFDSPGVRDRIEGLSSEVAVNTLISFIESSEEAFDDMLERINDCTAEEQEEIEKQRAVLGRDPATFDDKRRGIRDAAVRGDVGAVRRLLANGYAKVNAGDDAGRTPMHWAAYNGQDEVVRFLVEFGGGNIDATDSDGRTPLHLAADNHGSAAVAQFLVSEAEADTDAADTEGLLPIHIAAHNGHEDVCREVVPSDMDAQDAEGMAPLHHAAANGHEDVVVLLVEDLEAKTDITTNDGKSALDWAELHGHTACIEYLK